MHAADLDLNEMAKIEEILRRAQEIHRERGGVFGYDFESGSKRGRNCPAMRPSGVRANSTKSLDAVYAPGIKSPIHEGGA
jgi:hypothetical protein